MVNNEKSSEGKEQGVYERVLQSKLKQFEGISERFSEEATFGPSLMDEHEITIHFQV